jgi:hypothetical protein
MRSLINITALFICSAVCSMALAGSSGWLIVGSYTSQTNGSDFQPILNSVDVVMQDQQFSDCDFRLVSKKSDGSLTIYSLHLLEYDASNRPTSAWMSFQTYTSPDNKTSTMNFELKNGKLTEVSRSGTYTVKTGNLEMRCL